jgi:hypothetical protein
MAASPAAAAPSRALLRTEPEPVSGFPTASINPSNAEQKATAYSANDTAPAADDALGALEALGGAEGLGVATTDGVEALGAMEALGAPLLQAAAVRTTRMLAIARTGRWLMSLSPLFGECAQ